MKENLQACILFIIIYAVLFPLVLGAVKLIKWIKNKRKWERAKKRGLERFPIGSILVLGDNEEIKFKVINVWASHYKYEDAFCIRLEDEQGDSFRFVEGSDEILDKLKLLQVPEPTKLD